MLRLARQNTALATTAYTPDSSDHLVAGAAMHAQFVSDFLEAQTISGTIKMSLQMLEAHANNNLFLKLIVQVISGDGGTVRATLLNTTDGVELGTSIINRHIAATAITSYDCADGDRLKFEIGVSGTPTAAGGTQGHNASMRFGDPWASTNGEAPENDTDTSTTNVPWLEFSGDLKVSPFDALVAGFEQAWEHANSGDPPHKVFSTDAAHVLSGEYGLLIDLTQASPPSQCYTGTLSAVDANGDIVNLNQPHAWVTGHMKVFARPTTTPEIVGALSNTLTVRRCYLALKPTGELELRNTSGTVLSTTPVLSLETWYRVDFFIRGTTTSNGEWRFRLCDRLTGAILHDESGTGANFTANLTAGYSVGRYGTPLGPDTYKVAFDNWYLCLGSFMPDGIVDTVWPRPNGTSGSGWVSSGSTGGSSYTEVDDEPAGRQPDANDTDIWVSTVSGDERYLTFPSLASLGYPDARINRVLSIQDGGRIRDTGGASSVKVRLQRGAGNFDKNFHDPGNAYLGRWLLAEYDPVDGSKWTPANADASIWGVVNNANVEVRLTHHNRQITLLVNPRVIVPPKATLTLTTFAPTVTVEAAGGPQTIVPPTATLTLTMFAPVIGIGIIPAAAALTLTTFAPVMRLAVIPPTAALTLTTFAPTVLTPQTITPPTAALTLTTFAPAVTVGVRIIPPAASLTLSTFVPQLRETVTPTTAALTITTFAPVIGLAIVPGPASLVISSFAPVIKLGIVPTTATLTLTGFAPVIGLAVIPPTAALTLTTFAPTVTVGSGGGNVLVTVPVATLTLTAFAPVIGLAVVPPTASLTITGFAPVIGLGVIPGVAALTLTSFAPVIRLAVVPPTAALVLTTFAPVIKLGIIPGVLALTLATFAPTIQHAIIVPTRALTLTTFAPVVSAGGSQTIVPPTRALTLTTFAPSVLTPTTITPPTATLTLTRFAPVIGSQITIPTAALVLTAFAPLVTTPRIITPPTAALILTTFAPLLAAPFVGEIDLIGRFKQTASLLGRRDDAIDGSGQYAQTITLTGRQG